MIPIGKRAGTALAVSLLLGSCGKIRNEISSLEKQVLTERGICKLTSHH